MEIKFKASLRSWQNLKLFKSSFNSDVYVFTFINSLPTSCVRPPDLQPEVPRRASAPESLPRTVGEQVDIVSVKQREIDGVGWSAGRVFSYSNGRDGDSWTAAHWTQCVHVCILVQRCVCARLYGDALCSSCVLKQQTMMPRGDREAAGRTGQHRVLIMLHSWGFH